MVFLGFSIILFVGGVFGRRFFMPKKENDYEKSS
jgi:hypothetical protein